MMLQRLLGFRWDGLAVYMTIGCANSDIYLSKDKYFSNKENLLGDLAFSASSLMVPDFKKGHNSNLIEERKYLNTKLAKVWIKSKHCMRLLKAPSKQV